MTELRKIMVSVPDNLLKEIDTFVSVEKTDRSSFVREATLLLIKEKRRLQCMDKLKKGYTEMAKINIELSEVCFEADCEQVRKYEEKLRELGNRW